MKMRFLLCLVLAERHALRAMERRQRGLSPVESYVAALSFSVDLTLASTRFLASKAGAALFVVFFGCFVYVVIGERQPSLFVPALV
jgi:hypothetical protein